MTLTSVALPIPAMHAPLAVFLLRLVGLALVCAATLAAYGMAE